MYKDYIIVNGELYHADELYHYGVKGMRWGVRRFQNEDGSLTREGQKRLADSMGNIVDKSTMALYRGKMGRVNRLERKGEKEGKKIYEKVLTEEERSTLKKHAGKYFDATMEVNKYPDNMFDDPDSKEYKELHDKAYEYAAEKLKVDYPDFYEQLVTYDYEYDKPTDKGLKLLREHIEEEDDNYIEYLEKYSGQYEKQWKQTHKDNFKKREVAMKKYNQVEKEYMEECAKVTDRILGEYSKNRGLFKNRSEGAKYIDYQLKIRANGSYILDDSADEKKKKK